MIIVHGWKIDFIRRTATSDGGLRVSFESEGAKAENIPDDMEQERLKADLKQAENAWADAQNAKGKNIAALYIWTAYFEGYDNVSIAERLHQLELDVSADEVLAIMYEEMAPPLTLFNYAMKTLLPAILTGLCGSSRVDDQWDELLATIRYPTELPRTARSRWGEIHTPGSNRPDDTIPV